MESALVKKDTVQIKYEMNFCWQNDKGRHIFEVSKEYKICIALLGFWMEWDIPIH